jgi:hypothetical protein
MGKHWLDIAGSENKETRNIYSTWMDYSAEMGHHMAELLGGNEEALADIQATWAAWSQKMTDQLPSAMLADKNMQNLQDAWTQSSDRMNRYLTQQMTDQMAEYMRGTAHISGAYLKSVGETTTKDAQDFSEQMSKMSEYFAENYSKLMDMTHEILEKDSNTAQKAQDIFDSWSDFYSEMFKEVMRTDAFSRWLAQVRDSYLDAVIQAKRMNEETFKVMNLPTRTDIDEVNKALKDLAMDVKEIRSQLKKEKRGKGSS